MIERKQDRRRSASSYFTNPQNDRRRPGYERRNRTTVLPMPLSMVMRRERRRFEEAGTE